jgi:multidrug efflux system membrane fusion protein
MRISPKKTILLVSSVFVAIVLIVTLSQADLLHPESNKKGPREKAIPVKVALAELRDAPSYLNSIGTVQALNTVLVRSRVDGEINRILFQEGKYVKRGDILVELDLRPFEVQLRAAVAQKEKDNAQLGNTKLDLDRYELLVKQDSIATQTLDTTRALLDQLRATVSSDQAQIDINQLQLDYATIRSPIDGRLGAKLVDAGNLVHANDTNGIVIVSQIQPVFVTFSIPQDALPVVRQQQKRQSLKVIALNQDGSEILDEGKLTLIESQVDTATGTIRCKATFQNDNEKLWPGAYVTVRVVLNDLPNVVVVPTTAIQAGAQHPYVYVITPQNVVESKPVTVGPVSGNQTVIVAGLAAGERVVVEGQFQLEEGSRVDVKESPLAEAQIRP